jgi:hypothetical protein
MTAWILYCILVVMIFGFVAINANLRKICDAIKERT